MRQAHESRSENTGMLAHLGCAKRYCSGMLSTGSWLSCLATSVSWLAGRCTQLCCGSPCGGAAACDVWCGADRRGHAEHGLRDGLRCGRRQFPRRRQLLQRRPVCGISAWRWLMSHADVRMLFRGPVWCCSKQRTYSAALSCQDGHLTSCWCGTYLKWGERERVSRPELTSWPRFCCPT